MEHKSSINIPVPNETYSFTTRTTRDNKNLKYELKVLQQPLRARACGSGSKSSADRRPVDPPPIVQLRVLEVKPNANGDDTIEDITFMMNANYFLFATLEPARHMAQPRGMPDPNKPTVLTGTPVAGMVYLDRPDPAGYFIFPDLSVRHEGHFRLSFSLYEELKLAGDHDKVDDPSRAVSPGDNHVTHRLEVKSAVLQVFSAKKFPGLTESTALSRTVAEQGCRVRIRRDVRMRKTYPRDGKGGKEWDGYEAETAEHRAEMARTPDASYAHYPPPVLEPTARPRSSSNGSRHSLAASLSRRQSQQELAQLHQHQQQQQYHAQQQHRYGGTAPQTPISGVPPPSAYGPSPSQQQFSQPTYMQQPPPQPQQQPMQPPPAQYQSHAYPPAPPAPQQSGHYYQPAPTYQPQYAAPPPEANGHAHRASVDWSVKAEYRRPSVHHNPSAPPVHQQAPAPYSSHPYQQAPAPYQTQAPHQPNYYAPIEAKSTRAPPPEPIQPPTRTTAPTPPLSAKPYNFTLPPISHALEPASPAVHTPNSTNGFFPNSFAAQASGSDPHKRSYGSTFSTAHHDVAQKAGARPDTTYPQPPQATSLYSEFDVDNDDDEDDEDAIRRFMQSGRGRANRRPVVAAAANPIADVTSGYKRADGKVITQKS